MSDVLDEIINRLKQKAKTFPQMLKTNSLCCIEFPMCCSECKELCATEQWVRLEDVKEAIQQLKQNYVLIPRKKKCNDSEIFGSCRGKTHNYAYGAVLCKYYVNGFCKHPNSKYGKSC